jgi:predicted esterase
VPAIFTGTDAPSFHWGDDVLFDEQKGEIEMDSGFKTTSKILSGIIEVLTEKCNFPERNILFFGFGQGGMASLTFALSTPKEFSGIVSIGGPLGNSNTGSGSGKAKTPVLVCGGSRSTQITRGSVDRLKAAFGDVEYVKWGKSDDGMMRNREEMLPIMKFFARRLRSRAGVPEGAVEVG